MGRLLCDAAGGLSVVMMLVKSHLAWPLSILPNENREASHSSPESAKLLL